LSSDLLAKAQDAIAVVESGMAEDADLIRAYDAIDTLRARLKEFQEALATAAIAHIGDREVVNGDIKYSTGYETVKKIVSPRDVILWILENEGVEGLLRFVVSNPLKVASVMREYGHVMPPEWFKVERKSKLIVKRARILPGGKDSDDAESE
jgi:hypothetical protein